MAIKREYNRYLRSKKEVDTILFMCRESRKSYKWFWQNKDCDCGGIARCAFNMLKNYQKQLLNHRANRRKFLF